MCRRSGGNEPPSTGPQAKRSINLIVLVICQQLLLAAHDLPALFETLPELSLTKALTGAG